MSDVIRQVKHPPTCTIHSPFTWENFEICAKLIVKDTVWLVGSSSSGSGGVERGRTTNRLRCWQCGGIMQDIPMKLKKGIWSVPL